MIRFFIMRALLAASGAYLADAVVPAVITDGRWETFILFGLFIGIGELILYLVGSGLSLILFLIPGIIRTFLVRLALVAIATGLVTGFEFGSPLVVGLTGTTLLITLLFLIPFASSPK